MKIEKIFTLLIVLFPILSIYNTGISTLTFADIILFMLLPFFSIHLVKKNKNKSIKVSLELLIISVLIFLQMLLYSLFNISETSSVLTTLRVLLYYMTLAIFVKELFNIKWGIRYYTIVSLFASILYIIQFISLKVFNIFIPGTLPGFSTSADVYNSIMRAGEWTSNAYARPRSLFAEPSHFAVYVSLCLAILLLQNQKKNWKIIIPITIAMLISGSGMAIALCFIAYLMFFIKNAYKISKKKILYAICAIIIICPFLFYYTKTESFNIFFDRTFIEKDSTEGRFGNFIDSFDFNKKTYEVIFGEGMYKIADVEGQDYITSIPRIYTYFGIVGMIIFTFLSIKNFIKLRGINFISWFMLFVIAFASEILFHNMMFVFIPYIKKKKNYE